MFDWFCKYTPGFLLTSKYFNTFQGLETHIANSSKESQTTWLINLQIFIEFGRVS